MREELDGFVRLFEVVAGFDKRGDPKGDYGCGSMRLLFALRGAHGAVSCELRTDWSVPTTRDFWLGLAVGDVTRGKPACSTYGILLPAQSAEECARSRIGGYLCPDACVQYHALELPRSRKDDECTVCGATGRDGNDCWSTGGACWSWDAPKEDRERVRDVLIAEGLDGLWRELRRLYDAAFGEEARRRDASCCVAV